MATRRGSRLRRWAWPRLCQPPRLPGARPGLDRLAAHVRDRRVRRGQAGPGRRPRRSATAGVPRLRLRRDRARRRRGAGRRQEGRQARQPREGDRRPPAAGVHDRRRSHPLGHPRRAQRRQRAPARRATRGRVALVHNGIIENFAELRARLEADDHVLLSETDTEVAAQLLELQLESGVDLTVAMQRVCQQLEGAFTLVAVDALDPSRVVAARRNSPLVVGLGDGENFLGSDVAAFIEHTREALELGQDQVVTITRSGVSVTDFLGRPQEGRRYHVDWDLSAAEKEGHDWFMRKEIFEQPRAVADSLLGRRTRGRAAAARRDAALRPGAPRHRQDHHHRLRDVVLRRDGGQVRHRALDPGAGRGGAVLGVPLPRPDPRLLDAGGGDLAVRRDRGHAAGDPARADPAVEGAGDLQHQRLDDPARVRRRHLHPRRPGDRRRVDQGVPDPARRLLPARALPRAGARGPGSATRSPR